jgi:hypothetical protein
MPVQLIKNFGWCCQAEEQISNWLSLPVAERTVSTLLPQMNFTVTNQENIQTNLSVLIINARSKHQLDTPNANPYFKKNNAGIKIFSSVSCVDSP